VVNIVIEEKQEMFYMLELLLKRKLITELEYHKAKEKIDV